MKERNRAPRLHLIIGTGGSESDPCASQQGPARIRISRVLGFNSEESAGTVLKPARRTRPNCFPGGDAA